MIFIGYYVISSQYLPINNKMKRDKYRSKSNLSLDIMSKLEIKKERFLSRRQYAKFWKENPVFSYGFNFRTFRFFH